jgi:hypothetical protein
MVLFETTTALHQDDSALVAKSKDTDMNTTDPTQRLEESSDDEDDDANNDNDSSASDGDSAASGERAFGAFKANANSNLSEHKSIRRSNSWTSFLTRSERHREETEVPLSPQEVAKRKVQFRDDHELEEVRVLELDPPLTPSEKTSCHLSDSDNDRMQMEVQMTLMRWDNHEDGKIEFDDNRHSIRGLVEHVDEQCPERNRDGEIYHHMTRVLQEQLRQRTTGDKTVDHELVGQIARESALNESKRAQYIAQKDRFEAEDAWKAKPFKKLIDHGKEKAGVVLKKRWGEGEKKDKSPRDKSPKPTRRQSPTKDKDKKKGLGKLAFWK